MAIELEKGFDAKKFVSVVIFIVSLVIFAVLALSYLYFELGSQKLTKSITEKAKALAETEEETVLKSNLTLYENKIETFKNLFNNRVKTESVFLTVEKLCHPDVWFDSFNYGADDREIELSGIAPNFTAVAQQIIILKQHKDILSNIKLSGLAKDKEKGIKFVLNLTLTPQVFKQ